MAGQPGVVAQYTLSQPTVVLRFGGYGDLRKRTWRLDEGATLGASGTELRLAHPTRRLTVRVLPFARDGEVDRVYNPVVPFGDGRAAAVYSEYLLPKGGGVVRLANGGVVLGRVVDRDALAWTANDAATYLVVGNARSIRASDYTMTVDAIVPPWAVDALSRDVSALMNVYRTMFASAPSKAPWIVVTFDPSAAGAVSAFRGDTNPGMVRLNLMGSGWNIADQTRARTLESFVAHELMHLWNGELWTHPEAMPIWLYEGGADAAALDALHRIGRLSDEEVRDAEVASFANCAMARGKTLAEKVSAGGSAYYTCGSSVFYLAASLLGRQAGFRGPLELWQAMFDATRDQRSYALNDLQAAVERLSDADGKAALFDDLVTSKIAWSDSLRDHQDIFRIHAPRDSEQGSPALAATLLDSLVIDLVMKDCRGGVSVYSGQQVYQIGTLPACSTIKTDITARTLGGFSMHGAPSLALAYARERCAQGLALHFAGDDDHALDLPCARWIDMPAGIFVPDA